MACGLSAIATVDHNNMKSKSAIALAQPSHHWLFVARDMWRLVLLGQVAPLRAGLRDYTLPCWLCQGGYFIVQGFVLELASF